MTKELDRLAQDVACLNVRGLPFTLISTLGFHCNVWRSIGRIVTDEGSTDLDFVVKVGKHLCTQREVEALAREYCILRSALDQIVPESMFVATRINRTPGVIVFAKTCNPWFDLGNPANDVDALSLLRRQPRSREQLQHFSRWARHWLDQDCKIIDLYGAENLVLDRVEGVRYLDSFNVFFYLDILDLIEDVDDVFQFRVEQSIRRLEYIEWLVRESMRTG